MASPEPLPANVLRRASLTFLAGLVLVGLSLGFPIASALADASIANPDETGARDVAALVEDRAAQAGSDPPTPVYSSLEAIPPPDTDPQAPGGGQASQGPVGAPPDRQGVFVLGPAVPGNEDEAQRLWDLMNASGTVVVADDSGEVNSLLEELPTDTRVDNATLIDVAYRRQPSFPVLFTVARHPLTENVETVLANVAGGVQPDPNATRLIASSNSSWLDRDGDGTPGGPDARGPHTVMCVESIGSGELVVLSDPSIVTNAMLDEADNAQLASNLAEQLTRNRGEVFWDEAHRDYRPFALVVQALPAASTGTTVLVLVVLVALPALAWAGLRGARWAYERWLMPAVDRSTVVERTLNSRDQWSEAEVRRVVEGIPTPSARSDPTARERDAG